MKNNHFNHFTRPSTLYHHFKQSFSSVLYSFLRSSDIQRIRHFETELLPISHREHLIDYVLKFLKRSFDVDFVGWNEIDANSVVFLDVHVFPKFPDTVAKETYEPMVFHTPRHPGVNFFYKSSPRCLLTVSLDDIQPQSDFIETALYNEAYRKFEAKRLLFFHMPGRFSSRILLTLTRKNLPYNHRERALLDCLGHLVSHHLKRIPHPLNKFALMNILHDSLNSENESVLQLNSELRVVAPNPKLKSLFSLFFPQESSANGLPVSIVRWLESTLYDEKTGIQKIGISFQHSTVFRRWDRNLIVIWIKRPQDRYSILSFEEDQTAKHQYDTIVQSLTRRQRQVYHLVKDGTHEVEDIAKKLGISRRTAEGHKQNLQNILESKSL